MAEPVLGQSLQESIITLLVHDDNAGKIVAGQVLPTMFDGNYKLIAAKALDYWKKFSRAPAAHIDDELSDVLDDPHNRQAQTFHRVLSSMVELRPEINTQYILSKVQTFVRSQRLKGAIVKASDELAKSDFAPVEDVELQLNNILRIRDETFDEGHRLHDYEWMLSQMQGEQSEFLTGIPELDKRWISPYRGAVLLFLGAAGRGKSWWLINLGRRAMNLRKKVLHISAEMSELEVMQRYYQAQFSLAKRGRDETQLTQFEYDRNNKLSGVRMVKDMPDFALTDFEAHDELQVRVEKNLQRYNDVVIKQVPPRSVNRDWLMSFLDQLEGRGFIPDLLIFDYIGLWKTNTDNFRISLGRGFEDFRSVLVERSIAGATAQQLSKEGERAASAKGVHVAEDWSLIGTADMCMTYSCTDFEFDLGLGRLYVNKARSERDRFGLLLTQNYAQGQFALQSMFLPNNYFDIIHEKRQAAGYSEEEDTEEE